MHDEDLKQKVERIIEKTIRPYIISHEGDVTLKEVTDDGTVYIALSGACAGCPSADLGTKGMIQDILVREVPGVTSVELERTASPEMVEYISKILSHEIVLD